MDVAFTQTTRKRDGVMIARPTSLLAGRNYQVLQYFKRQLIW
jgi:hypothetical protein